MKYIIDYEYGTAWLYTSNENWRSGFLALAGQCFGVRKSIGEVYLIGKEDVEPEQKLKGEHERLEHTGGDVIVWNKRGKKIKSEWD